MLSALADFEPAWTLTGGGALAGFHTGHRTTRDLDLFWRSRKTLDDLPRHVGESLTRAGLVWKPIQTSDTFCRFEVTDGAEVCLLDLVAEPWSSLTPPDVRQVGGGRVWIDTPYEILVNKLVAMLGRSELRDLEDVSVLLAAGGDLERALADAPKKDGGFSPLTLAWLLQSWDFERLTRSARWETARAQRVASFRDAFVERLLRLAQP